ncbi:MAG TPA: serine/threonine-protein kinase [Pyrinomonadaceae bacterium]|jgi:serine/threonine protein kinase/soluble lytic murein transglycosylase-like protein
MSRWRELEEVLQKALDRAPEERAAFLDEACVDDAELKREARELVHAYEEAGDFMEEPAIITDARVIACDAPDAHVGRSLGPYRILERLGAGGMGEVYLAEDMRLSRLVALKLLPRYFVSDDERLRRFQREARAASALNHPNIITIHEVGEFEATRFIATEFIDGETIRALIERGDLSLADVLDVGIQTAHALSAAHAAGIVHRDIKPENIMRRKDGIVKILDFGIAKLMEPFAAGASDEGEAPTLIKARTEAGAVLGTVAYMSPEQARALEVDERTDIWSLGVLLYEMTTSRAPFTGETRLDTLVHILEREPPPLFHAADAQPSLQHLQRIISRALRKERNERYQTARSMAADLELARQALPPGPHAHERESAELSLQALRDDGELERDAFKPAAAAWRHGRAGVLLVAAVLLLLGAIALASLYRSTSARRNASVSQGVETTKLYAQMSEAEQLAFISEQERRVSAMMGDRPAQLDEEALRAIKLYVDAYAARTLSQAEDSGKEPLETTYARAVPLVPLIARSFAARKVPVIIGIYLPMIESGYEPCFESPSGAKGLFQFMPQTARQYGLAPEEVCNLEKMTPVAAHYIADRMAELGDDAQSMTLVLLSYNRGAEWVRGALRQLRETENYERNFWTLLAHRDRLDDTFRRENAGYVPNFFAAAIIGENPQAFGLSLQPLSAHARS